mgnify:FL=1
MIWIGGYYQWNGARWEWMAGRLENARPYHDWVAPRYDAARHLWYRGHWELRRMSDDRIRPLPSPETSASAGASFNASINASASATVR